MSMSIRVGDEVRKRTGQKSIGFAHRVAHGHVVVSTRRGFETYQASELVVVMPVDDALLDEVPATEVVREGRYHFLL